MSELARVPPPHWNESVFRFFIVRRFLADMPKLECETECNKIDLVFPSPEGLVLLELKFFDSRPMKTGGPTRKNFWEYEDNIEKLRTIRDKAWISTHGGVAHAHLLLAYFDPVTTNKRKRTYGSYYDGIAPGGPISSVRTILERAPVGQGSCLTCKLITVDVARAI